MSGRLAILFAFGAAILFAAGASAGDPSPTLKIEDAWVRAMPPSAGNTAAYMTLINDGDKPVRLTGGSTPIAGSVSPMITTRKQVSGTEVLGMADVDALEIPAHGRCVLKPGGDHLMIISLKSHPKPGDHIQLTLHFEPGRKDITLDVAVRQ